MQYQSESKDRRCFPDRRKRLSLKYLLAAGRREKIRRNEDKKKHIILDKYSPWLFAFFLTILTLSVLDGLFTLHLIGRGAVEINPIMHHLLDINPWLYMASKYFITCFALTFLLIFNNLYIRPLGMRIRSSFPAIVIIYLMAISWEFFLWFK
jgi:hypothetical protein